MTEREAGKTDDYVVGIDGGGTKTSAAVCDTAGNELERFTAGPVNYNGAQVRIVEESVRSIFVRLEQTRGLENCRAVCLGAAGISNSGVKERLETLIRRCGYQNRLEITGDHRTALYGALGEPRGAILIAGTGSVCYGRSADGREHRTGGFGHLIDDGGSGYAIGRDILSAAVRAFDGRAEPTLLSGLLASQAGLRTPEDIVRFVYDKKTGKREIAALAKLLPSACEGEDGAALEIVSRCGAELYGLASPVLERLDLREGRLALAGGILRKDPFVRKELLARLNGRYPLLRCVAPLRDAALGAALMALRAG